MHLLSKQLINWSGGEYYFSPKTKNLVSTQCQSTWPFFSHAQHAHKSGNRDLQKLFLRKKKRKKKLKKDWLVKICLQDKFKFHEMSCLLQWRPRNPIWIFHLDYVQNQREYKQLDSINDPEWQHSIYRSKFIAEPIL